MKQVELTKYACTWRILIILLWGDQTYGGRARLPKGIEEDTIEALRGFKRQALHAKKLELWHPATGEQVSWEVPLPGRLEKLLAVLKKMQRVTKSTNAAY